MLIGNAKIKARVSSLGILRCRQKVVIIFQLFVRTIIINFLRLLVASNFNINQCLSFLPATILYHDSVSLLDEPCIRKPPRNFQNKRKKASCRHSIIYLLQTFSIIHLRTLGILSISFLHLLCRLSRLILCLCHQINF